MVLPTLSAFARAWGRVQDLTGAIEDSPEETELVELINAMEEYEREHTF